MGEEGEATLGGSWMDTLGRPGDRMQPWPDEGGPRRRHDSNRSRRLVMALTWDMDVGGSALVRAPDITSRRWMILSLGVGAGMER